MKFLKYRILDLRLIYAIIFINLCVYLYEFFLLSADSSLEFSILYGLNIYFFEGFYWQIFTNMFLHGNFTHIFMNMAALFQLGIMIQRLFLLRTLGFLLLYILGGILTSILSLSYLFINPNVNLIGASGAICVLIGFLIYYDKINAKPLFIALLLFSLIPPIMGMNVAWYAHLFGALVGFVFAFLHRKFIV